jgi:hypothetical protein
LVDDFAFFGAGVIPLSIANVTVMDFRGTIIIIANFFQPGFFQFGADKFRKIGIFIDKRHTLLSFWKKIILGYIQLAPN